MAQPPHDGPNEASRESEQGQKEWAGTMQLDRSVLAQEVGHRRGSVEHQNQSQILGNQSPGNHGLLVPQQCLDQVEAGGTTGPPAVRTETLRQAGGCFPTAFLTSIPFPWLSELPPLSLRCSSSFKCTQPCPEYRELILAECPLACHGTGPNKHQFTLSSQFPFVCAALSAYN